MKIKKLPMSMNEKILLAIYELGKKRSPERKITKEEMVIKVWEMFPEDFCLKGYPQYPNADISKYITKLFKDNLVKGSFYNYTITQKGKEYAENITCLDNKRIDPISSSREVEAEIRRIKTSKVFQIFLKGENEFLESDLFDFLGTSSRALSSYNKTAFISKYNLILKEVIPFCEKIRDRDIEAGKIILLSEILLKKFGEIINTKLR